MPNDIDLSNESLLARRAIAEKALPGAFNGENDYYIREQRAGLEHSWANTPKVVIADIEEILRLRSEVERLNKEAEWLADHCREFCESFGYCGECPMFSGWLKREHEDCGETVGYRGEKHTANWRVAARKAVEESLGPKKPDA